MGKSLVIVESPTKAKTISKFLGADFMVESSIGHVRDLPESAKDIPASLKKEPWARVGIQVDADFRPLYIIPERKEKQIALLKKLLKTADALYLATDEDREGEAISWHLTQVLEPTVPTHRLVFHEITRQAIQNALQHTRQVDARLVTAQETRRVLDRLYGYEISPLLWRKIGPQLSAGRVQSVALRVLVARERERMAFRAAQYWGLEAQLTDQQKDGKPFTAKLAQVSGKKIAEGGDFDPATGSLSAKKKDQVTVLDEPAARALAQTLTQAAWVVDHIEEKPFTSQPAAPFITSTLQQEASRKLRLTPQETMRVAQSLYEEGYITYMRTDSTSLSEQAIAAARGAIAQRFGKEFLPPAPREYRSKVKNAQEAHEAVRPAGEQFTAPEDLPASLNRAQKELYELIWKRTLASQMPDSKGKRTTLSLSAGEARFSASGQVITFPGFRQVYLEGTDEPEDGEEGILPTLTQGQKIYCQQVTPQDHTTQPPRRFTEAVLIRELEKAGVGRPSTYASIIDTITRRYVFKKGGSLVPTFTAIAVVALMEEYFPHLVDLSFTAHMEDTLDAIANGDQQHLPYLKDFYFGSAQVPGLVNLVKAEIDPRKACTIAFCADPEGRAVNIRVGKYGPYLERGEDRASLPMDMPPDELTPEKALALVARGNAPDLLGYDPATALPVYLKVGRFGPYVQLGPAEAPPEPESQLDTAPAEPAELPAEQIKEDTADTETQGKKKRKAGAKTTAKTTAKTGKGKKKAPPVEKPKMKSLLPGQTPETLTLEQALELLSLPRVVGEDVATGEPVLVDYGRFGPYAKKGADTRSLPSPNVLFTIGMDELAALFAQPKSFRRGQAQALREIGAVKEGPNTGALVKLMNGRFGPYVTDGELNASLPRGTDPAQLTLDEALELLAKRAAMGPAKPRGRFGKAAGKKAGAAPAKKAGKKGSQG
ncbi:MAG: type I DNA topoisomerase [Deltaproteobacteria bacterium]|nr:type I DNA topoisomerase [Deltaproteobacteria bacterium]